MGTIQVKGLGDYEIAGDVPTEAERQAMLQALAEKAPAQQGVIESSPLVLQQEKTEEDDSTLEFLSDEVLTQAFGGVRDAAQSALNLIVNRPAQWAGVSFFDEEGNYDLDYTPENAERPFKPLELPTVAPAETATGNAVRTMSQFFVPYLGAMKVIGVGRGVLSNLARAESGAILTEQVVFDPFDEKLSDLVQEYPVLRNPITQYLQADEDDTEAEARFKLALESAGLGVMFTTITQSIKGLTALKKGNNSKALDEISKGQKAAQDINEAATPSSSIYDAMGENAPKSQLEGTLPVRDDNIWIDKYVGKDVKSTEDLRNVIKTFARDKKDEIDVYRGGPRSERDVAGMANDLGMTSEEVLSREFGEAWSDSEAYAARILMAESATNIHDLARIANSTGLDSDLLKLKDAVDTHTALQGQVMGIRAEAGRALRQWRYVVGTNVDEMLNAAGGKKNMADMAKMLSAVDPKDTATMNKLAKTMNDPTLSDKWLEVWINGLLSGPQTQVVNALSNTLTGIWSIPEHYMAAGVGLLRGTKGRVTFGEANARAWGWLQGAREGLSLAKKTFLTETPSDVFSKMEARREKAIKGKLGEFVRLPGRALMTSDEFFKSIGHRMELNAQAYRSAIDEGLKPNSREFAEHMKEVIDNPSDAISMKAIDNARYLTFTKPLEGASQHLTKAQAQLPALRLIAPFVRTPVNIVRFAAERTPFGMLMRESRGLKGVDKDIQTAKMALAAMAGGSAAFAAAEGKITGSGPTDPAARARLRETGWQPYSFGIPQEDGTKRYLAFNRIEPLGILLGLSADFADIAGSLGEEDAASIAARITGSISQNLTDKTFFRGITDIIEAVNDPDRFMEAYARNMLGTVVPTGLAQIARSQDPVLRETLTVMDRIKSRIPGYSQDLPARRNLWGQPILLTGGLGPDIISPIYSSFSKNDPVSDELIRLEYYPSMPPRSIGGTEVPQDLYNKFVERAGRPAHKILQRLVQSPGYKRLDKLPSQQIELIRKVMESTRNTARQILKLEMGLPFTRREQAFLRDVRRSQPELFENLQIPERIRENI